MSQSWNTPVTLNDWMRNVEKRLMNQERRPAVRPAFDIVGPGMRTYSVEVRDWNSEGPIVDGFFYSTADQVINSPDDAKNWMGITQANSIGQGLQRVWEYTDATDAPSPDPALFTRSFVTLADGTRDYTAWVSGGGGGGGGGTGVGYTFVQGTPQSTWTIDHTLTYQPNVTVVDSTGRQTEGDVVYTDADTITITFSAAFSGKAYLS